MNRLILKAILVSSVVPFMAVSQWSEIKQNQINTYGSATLYYPADRVQFSFTVAGLGSSIEEAVQQATERASLVGKKLMRVGVTDKQLQTSYFNSADNPEGKSWWTSSKDFATIFHITVTLDSFALIEPAIQALAGEPIDRLSKLQFSLTGDSTKQLAALRAAAEDAKRKADLVAGTLGASIVRVLYVEDMSSFSAGSVEVTASAPPHYVYTGKQFPISSRLRVCFELGDKVTAK